jgi:hypothetical protein
METLGSAGLRGQETTVVGELALVTVADTARGLPLGRWVWGVFATTWCDGFRMFTANAYVKAYIASQTAKALLADLDSCMRNRNPLFFCPKKPFLRTLIS